MRNVAFLLGLPLLLAAAPPPGMDLAGNRIARFDTVGPVPARNSEESERHSALHCTADRRWCARLQRGEGERDWRLHIHEGMPGAGRERIHAVSDPMGHGRFDIWPRVVREAGGAILIGVIRYWNVAYARGGAGGSVGELIRVEPGSARPAAVLDVRTHAARGNGLCFDDLAERNRSGACMDIYDFDTAFRLDPSTRSGRPRFLYSTRASTYPGRRPLRAEMPSVHHVWRRDLYWAGDPDCTYRRRFSFDESAGRYLPDRPLPDCEDYLFTPEGALWAL